VLRDRGGQQVDDARRPMLAPARQRRLHGRRPLSDLRMQRQVDEAGGTQLRGSPIPCRIASGVPDLQIDRHARGEQPQPP
jgi:hypothetical protein